MDIVTIVVVIFALFFTAVIMSIIFLKLLRRVNMKALQELNRIKMQQDSLEKLIVKFIQITADNKREIARIKKETEKVTEATTTTDSKQETKQENKSSARKTEKAIARTQ